MVKSISSVLISVFIFIFVGIAEQTYLKNTFESLHSNLSYVMEKEITNQATLSDVENIQELWFKKKKILHLFIPHNDIKEIDLWLSEAVSYKKLKNTEECTSKMSVALCLFEQLPINYLIKWENVF